MVDALLVVLVTACSASPSPGPSTPSSTASQTHWVVPDVDAVAGELGVPTGVLDRARFTVLKVQRVPDEARVAHPQGAFAASIKLCTVETTDVFRQGWSVFVSSGQEFGASEGFVGVIEPGEDYAGDLRPYSPEALGVKGGCVAPGGCRSTYPTANGPSCCGTRASAPLSIGSSMSPEFCYSASAGTSRTAASVGANGVNRRTQPSPSHN